MSTRELVALVPHPDRAAVLTTGDGVLPAATSSGTSVTILLAAVEARLGSLPPVLRIVVGPFEPGGEATLRLLDFETMGPEAPAGFRWTDTDALDLESAAPPGLHDAIGRAIGRHRDGPGPLDPPWSRPGWFEQASAWMTDRMTALGFAPTGPPRVVYLWGISIVLRAESAAGAMYLKTSAPIFGSEAAVTAVLARVTPDLVTHVAAIEPDEGWLLMHDHGGTELGEGPSERWPVGLDLLATIQQAWTHRTAELAAAGAAIRPLAELAENVERLGTQDVLAAQLTADDRRAWDAAVPAFVAACRRLDELGPAATVVHGDFHPWNVTDDPRGPRIFDWTDAAISHPFTDLAVYAMRADDVALRRSMRDAYLAHWADHLGPAALVEAGDLAIVVGTLYQVESYVRIVESLAPDDIWDLADATGSWARAAIDALQEGIALVRPGHADG